MSAYLNALREEGTREDLLREVERQMEKADTAYAKGFADARERAAEVADAHRLRFALGAEEARQNETAKNIAEAIRALTPESPR